MVTTTAVVIDSLLPNTDHSPCTLNLSKKQICWYLFFLSFVLLYGDVRLLNPDNTWFQRSVDNAVVDTVQVSCLTELSATPERMLERTKEQARLGSKLVVWSEAIFTLHTQADVDQFHAQLQNVSRENGVYVVGTYYAGTDRLRNMAVVADDTGKLIVQYQKVHPVPGVEDKVDPGTNPLATAHTSRFGTIGVAICFDLDFPQFVQQAGAAKVDLLIQPSQTWGPIRELHSMMDSTRAVENGLTLLRCSSYGFSGIYNTYHRTLASYESAGEGLMIAQLPLTKHTHTMYAAMGEWFGWLCLSVVGILLVLLVVARVRAGHSKVSC
eukprot:c8915_g1_i1.p1 GENE.c8915_g1_i1~~c8915_g1_i1.p1  ORF type:complete len:325 (+),score=87.75 c8915_g1_i1:736-1710(+)